MKVTVKYFASVREAMGCGSEQLDTQATLVGQQNPDTGVVVRP